MYVIEILSLTLYFMPMKFWWLAKELDDLKNFIRRHCCISPFYLLKSKITILFQFYIFAIIFIFDHLDSAVKMVSILQWNHIWQRTHTNIWCDKLSGYLLNNRFLLAWFLSDSSYCADHSEYKNIGRDLIVSKSYSDTNLSGKLL